jgi:hypothetical protein
VSVAGFTVRDAVPLLAKKFPSPAKLAPTPLLYVLALIPDSETLLRVATPLALVLALSHVSGNGTV